jgi:hypothetical protein
LNIQQKYMLAGGKYLMHKGMLSYLFTKRVWVATEGGIGYTVQVWGLDARYIWNAVFKMQLTL